LGFPGQDSSLKAIYRAGWRSVLAASIVARGIFRGRAAKGIIHLKRNYAFGRIVIIVDIDPFIFEKLIRPGGMQKHFLHFRACSWSHPIPEHTGFSVLEANRFSLLL